MELRIEPVCAPLPRIPGHRKQTEVIGGKCFHGTGPCKSVVAGVVPRKLSLPDIAAVLSAWTQFVSPWIELLLQPAAVYDERRADPPDTIRYPPSIAFVARSKQSRCPTPKGTVPILGSARPPAEPLSTHLLVPEIRERKDLSFRIQRIPVQVFLWSVPIENAETKGSRFDGQADEPTNLLGVLLLIVPPGVRIGHRE